MMAAEGSRIAVLGGRGMLGSDLVQICRQRGFNPIVLDLPEFDITDADQLQQAVDGAD